jgi:phosphate transport system substrate-binding protein
MLGTMKRAAVTLVAGVLMLGGAVSAETKLQGGGATFPNPIYQRWVTEYQKAHPDVKIDYQSIGSGGGIKGITDKTFDFAGSDAPMNKKEMDAAKDPIVHIPTVAGSVVLAYNLPDVQGEIKLTGPIVADIYMGKINKWNDPKITAINAGTNLPDLGIVPVYRSDGSGTTFVFTNYLTTQSEEYTGNVGAGKQVKFPVGQGGKGNEGVTAGVQGTKGGIGYIELNYATANKIPFALLQNKDGEFIKASPETVAAAGEGAVSQMKDSLAVNIWNQPGKNAYPISAFTYILVYKDLGYLKDASKAKALVDFLSWATGDGQQIAQQMDYAPLSPSVQKKAKEAIGGLMLDGKPAVASR